MDGAGRVLTFTVICRSCGDEQQVRVLARSASSPGEFVPEYCRGCESTDLVALRDLSDAELEEIHAEVARRAPSVDGETPSAPREGENTANEGGRP